MAGAATVPAESSKKIAVVDGANVAYEATGGMPQLSQLVEMRQTLVEQGFDPVVIVDASLHHEIDDPDQLEGLLDQGSVLQAPAGATADYFVLEVAAELGAIVVSNDQFEQYRSDYPWIEERRVPYMIVRGQVHLYRPEKAS